jgi:hypothetical protein
MTKLLLFFNNNKHFKVIFYLLINGLSSFLAKYLANTSVELSLIFGAALNYLVWLSMKKVEENTLFDGHQAIDTDFDLGIDHED